MAVIDMINRCRHPASLNALLRRLQEGTAWWEVPTITLVALGVAWLVNPEDLLTLSSRFPWMVLAPLLVGLRYGFAWAALSTILLLLADSLHARWLGIPWRTPGGWLLGTLAVSLIAGEFREVWERRLIRLERAGRYREARMAEFTRSYHVLKRSHALLEQELALNGFSLYGALQDIRRQLLAASDEAPCLAECAHPLLQLLTHYGEVQSGALFAVREGRVELQEPLAATGHFPMVDGYDPLIVRAMKTARACCIEPATLTRHSLAASGRLLACIPLVDSQGNNHALLAVHRLPFDCLNATHLERLAVLCGHVADSLDLARVAGNVPHGDSDVCAFHVQLVRCIHDVAAYRLNAGLVAVRIGNFGLAPALIESMRMYRRALDKVLVLNEAGSEHCIALVLMPLSDSQDVDAYVNEFPDFLKKYHRVDMGTAEVVINAVSLNDCQTGNALTTFLKGIGYPLVARLAVSVEHAGNQGAVLEEGESSDSMVADSNRPDA
ncbi:PelD GGDEF domain-containing protein [Kistimonas scapharcae]|uniref:PelD GGDEF domain-containing protein n=1 Tax=Kistimonas scapharcae TaxID=1036133 RepID=A0ABP8VA37_9GAMM